MCAATEKQQATSRRVGTTMVLLVEEAGRPPGHSGGIQIDSLAFLFLLNSPKRNLLVHPRCSLQGLVIIAVLTPVCFARRHAVSTRTRGRKRAASNAVSAGCSRR